MVINDSSNLINPKSNVKKIELPTTTDIQLMKDKGIINQYTIDSVTNIDEITTSFGSISNLHKKQKMNFFEKLLHFLNIKRNFFSYKLRKRNWINRSGSY